MKMSKGLKLLLGSRSVLLVIQGFTGLFIPIFLFDFLGQSVFFVICFYILNLVLNTLLVPIGASFLGKFGFRNSLKWSVFLGVLTFILFYFATSINFWIVFFLAPLLMALYTIFYWVPFHVEFSKLTSNKKRGRQLSLFSVVESLTAAIVPIVSGWAIVKYDFDFIFILVIVLYVISGLFYIKLPRIKERFEWGYFQTFKECFSKKHRSDFLAFVSEGAESIIGFIIWPIFVYNLLDGNYFGVGAVSALTVLITIILNVLLGKYMDKGKGNKSRVLKFGAVMYSLGWVAKIFVLTAFQIFVAGVYHMIMAIFFRSSFNVMTYDFFSRSGHYVDEFTVLREIALNIGGILSLAFILIITIYFSVQWTFLIAAMAAILMNIFRKDLRRVA